MSCYDSVFIFCLNYHLEKPKRRGEESFRSTSVILKSKTVTSTIYYQELPEVLWWLSEAFLIGPHATDFSYRRLILLWWSFFGKFFPHKWNMVYLWHHFCTCWKCFILYNIWKVKLVQLKFYGHCILCDFILLYFTGFNAFMPSGTLLHNRQYTNILNK